MWQTFSNSKITALSNVGSSNNGLRPPRAALRATHALLSPRALRGCPSGSRSVVSTSWLVIIIVPTAKSPRSLLSLCSSVFSNREILAKSFVLMFFCLFKSRNPREVFCPYVLLSFLTANYTQKIWIKNWKCVLFSAPAHEMKRAVFVCDKMIEVGILIFCPHSDDFRIFWIFFCSWLRIMTFCF